MEIGSVIVVVFRWASGGGFGLAIGLDHETVKRLEEIRLSVDGLTRRDR